MKPLALLPKLANGTLLRVLLALLAVSALSGCAAFAPPRPYTTEQEAIAERGEPTRRWDNGDTTHTLEFSNQPDGPSTLMVQVDQGGIVLRQWDALSAANLARVKRGMTQEEVSRLLGSHRSEQTFPSSHEVVWDWSVAERGYGSTALFNVHFVEGKVARTSYTYSYPPNWDYYGPWGPWGPYPYPGYPFHPRRWPGSPWWW